MLDRIEASQTRVLNSLLSSARVLRLVEQEALDGAAAYAPLDFLGDVRHGVLSEIYAPAARRSTPIAATCSAPTSKRSATASTARRRSPTTCGRSSAAS